MVSAFDGEVDRLAEQWCDLRAADAVLDDAFDALLHLGVRR